MSKSGRQQGDHGAAAVEFALVAIIFFTLVFGIIEFGRAIWIQQGLAAASREGARFGVATGTNSGVPQYRNCNAIKQAAIAKVPDLGLTTNDVVVRYELYSPGPTAAPTSTPSATPTAAPTAAPTATLTCSAATPSLKDGDKVVVSVTKQMDVNLPLVPLGPFTFDSRDERSLYLGSTP